MIHKMSNPARRIFRTDKAANIRFTPQPGLRRPAANGKSTRRRAACAGRLTRNPQERTFRIERIPLDRYGPITGGQPDPLPPIKSAAQGAGILFPC